MARLKDFTVRRLRELARKHLGPGHSKLKTKEQLIAALRKIVPALGQAPVAVAKKRASAKPARGARAGKRPAKAEGPRQEPAPPVVPQGPRTPKAEVIRFEKPPMPDAAREELAAVQRRASGMAGEARPRIVATE